MSTDYAKLVAENLNYYLRLNEKTQKDVADHLKVSKATVSLWCSGDRFPRSQYLEQLCEYLHITKAQLMTEAKRQDKRTMPVGVRIPVLGKVAAGLPIEAVENIIDYEEIPVTMSKKGEYFGLVIKGDSMNPRIYSGDVVIVKKQPDAECGQIVIASVGGEDATCKKFIRYPDSIALLSLNAKYPPLIFSGERQKEVTIWGIVVEVRGKLSGV